MIDLCSETALTLAEAAQRVPPYRGKRTHLSTILRWILTGTKAPDGRRVHLEGCRCGSRCLTAEESLQRFPQSLTPRLSAEPTPTPRSPPARRRDSERAEQELERHGI